MIKHIKDDLYQFGECVSDVHGHEAVRAYVLLNQGQPIIYCEHCTQPSNKTHYLPPLS